MLTSWRTRCAPTAPGCDPCPRQRSHDQPADAPCGPARTWSHARVAMANQLRAHLQTTLPGAIGLFRDIDSTITLRFLRRSPTRTRSTGSPHQLGNWLRSVGYNHLATSTGSGSTSTTPPRGTPGVQGAAPGRRSRSPWSPLTALSPRSRQSRSRSPPTHRPPRRSDLHLAAQVRHRPRGRLLAEIGDCPRPLPTPEALACLAGAHPLTHNPARSKSSPFRWAVDKQLRGAVIDFAGGSHHANPWAADLYQRAHARGRDHPHATRILARAWLHIIWRCFGKTEVPYDPAKHHALQRLHNPAA